MMFASTPERRRHALVVGINKYPGLVAKDLKGCVNDATVISELLRSRFGFPAKNVSTLLDGQATRAAILQGMAEVAAQCGGDDVVVFHFSGHGSQMADREGDKPSGWDETIMPCDSGRGTHPNRDITDDEIHDWLSRLAQKTSNVTLIFDSCHSGSIARGRNPPARLRWVERDTRSVESLPLSPFAVSRPQTAQTMPYGRSGWLPLGQKYTLLAACRESEGAFETVSREAEGTKDHGALTYFLAKALRAVEAGHTYRDVMERVSYEVTSNYPAQHPQLEGARDRELFGLRDFESPRFIPINRRERETVVMAGGAAHGVTLGSWWDVYAPGTRRVGGDVPRLGAVQVTELGAVEARAEIVETGEGSIEATCRAFEVGNTLTKSSMAINIVAHGAGFETPQGKLHERVAASPLLNIAASDDPAAIHVHLLPPRARVDADSPVPQLGAAPEARWAVVGGDGALLMPPYRVGDGASVERLYGNLERYCRFLKVSDLRNPDQGLLDKVEFTLLRRRPGADWEEALPDAQSAHLTYEEGDCIAFRVVNRHDENIYVSVLDLGLTYRVRLLYPVAGASEEVPSYREQTADGEPPCGVLEVGTKRELIELYLPADFPFASQPGEEPPEGGWETFKLVVTTEPTDFTWLQQSGIRKQPRSGSPLAELFYATATGLRQRDTRFIFEELKGAWATFETRFFLRRRRE